MANSERQGVMSVGAHIRLEATAQRAWATRMEPRFREESQSTPVRPKVEAVPVATAEELRYQAIRRYFS
jgi:hypothetical protein